MPEQNTERRQGERRVGDRRHGDRRRRTRLGQDRRRGPRRVHDRRREPWVRLLLVTLLAMLSLIAPPFSQADQTEDTCLSAPISLEFYGRARESVEMPLTHCNGTANEEALFEFSSLLRPRGVARPSVDTPRETSLAEGFIAPGIRRFDPQLMLRLQALSDHWPGKRITVVSGYRSRARSTSRHFAGRALDVRVQGVHRAEVAEFARSLPGTGVGFYPASTFTHIDVRQNESFWVDQSAPGQRSRYAPQLEEDGILAAMLATVRPTQVATVEEPAAPAAEPTSTGPSARVQGLLAEALAQVRDDLTPLERTVLRRPLAPLVPTAALASASPALVDGPSPSPVPESPVASSPSPSPSPSPIAPPSPDPSPPVAVAPPVPQPPTVAPSQSPAVAPSQPPAVAPSQPPTVAPSQPPAVAPSQPPTVAPSRSPGSTSPVQPVSPSGVDWTIPWKGE